MADAAVRTAIVGLVATMMSGLGGYWLAGRNEESRDRRAATRESVARRAAFAERLEEQRHTFQRDTLLELQDGLQRMARIEARMNMQDRKTLNEDGQLFLLPSGMSDEAYQNLVNVRRLKSRVLDADLRERIDSFVSQCSDNRSLREVVGKEGQPEEMIRALKEQMKTTTLAYVAMSDLLGERLRAELDRRYLAVDPQQGDGTREAQEKLPPSQRI